MSKVGFTLKSNQCNLPKYKLGGLYDHTSKSIKCVIKFYTFHDKNFSENYGKKKNPYPDKQSSTKIIPQKNSGEQKALLWRLGISQGCLPLPHLAVTSSKRQEKQIRATLTHKEELKIALLAADTTVVRGKNIFNWSIFH